MSVEEKIAELKSLLDRAFQERIDAQKVVRDAQQVLDTALRREQTINETLVTFLEMTATKPHQ